jgi:hypothetical protein
MIPWYSVGSTTFTSYVLFVCYEVVSGLKVNIVNSILVPMRNVDNVVELASILGSGTSSLPLKYLGLPLGARFKAKYFIWDCIVEKIEHRLASWKECTCQKVVQLPH